MMMSAVMIPRKQRPAPRRIARSSSIGVFALSMLLASVAGAHAEPLSIQAFFRIPQYYNVTLSPSGHYLAVIAPVDDQRGLIVLDLDTRGVTRLKTPGNGDLLRVVWQNDERLLLVIGDLQVASGEPPRETGFIAVNRDGSDTRVIAGAMPRSGAGSSIAERGFQRPWYVTLLRPIEGTNEIFVTARDRNQQSLDVYRYDTVSGNKTLLTVDSPGDVSRWVVDFDGVPRAAVVDDVDHDVSAWYVRKSATEPWVRIEQAKLGRLDSVPMQFDPDGKLLYASVRQNGADRASIREYDIGDGAWKATVAKHPERDVEEGNARFVADYRERKLLGLRYTDDRPSVAWFDAEWARIQKGVDAALPDTVNVLQHGKDRWVVVAYSDRNPGEAHVLDAKTMHMEKLGAYHPWIDPGAMAARKWVRYSARDGMTIPALLTLRPQAVSKPVPLVVDIHGGPNVHATPWGFDPEVQFLASRGYAVLQPQYRGTLGYGWKLQSSGYRKWGDEMQDDLEDGVKWAVAQGIADADRVCFYGASYGGYAAAWGAIRNAKIIKCSVAYVAVTSIDYLFDNGKTDLSRLADRTTLMVEQIGDPKTDRARWKRVNPLDNADKVGVPLLLAYGASDARVPLEHGTNFRAALDNAKKPYEWVVYADEGHGFEKEANVIDFYGRVERFLAKYLGGIATSKDTPN